jgi:hypothetical protein
VLKSSTANYLSLIIIQCDEDYRLIAESLVIFRRVLVVGDVLGGHFGRRTLLGGALEARSDVVDAFLG